MFGDKPLLGQAEVSMDEKGRIALPSFTHVEEGETIYQAFCSDFLSLFSEAEVTKKVIALTNLRDNAKDEQLYLRLNARLEDLYKMFNAKPQVVGDHRRIVLAKDFRNSLADNHLIVAGNYDHLRVFHR